MFFLIWTGLWRIPARTMLTLVSLSVAFLMFGLLQGVNSAFDAIDRGARADRLLIDPRFNNPLPRSDADQIARVSGVTAVTWAVTLPAYFQERRNSLMLIMTEPQSFLSVYDEYRVSAAQRDALLHTRGGVLVAPELVKRMGWKLGERIPLTLPFPRIDGAPWSFEIVGFVENTGNPSAIPLAIGNFDYFNEGLPMPQLKDKVERIVVRVSDPRHSVETGRAIDRLFANSDAPSQTQAESAFAQSTTARISDLRRLTWAIVGAVFFSILCLIANVVRQTVRERTSEFGTLKSIGFSAGSIVWLVSGETLLMCLLGAAVGLVATLLLFPVVAQYLPMVSGTPAIPRLSYTVLFAGLLTAVLLTALSAALPAWNAMRLEVVDALRVRA